MAAKPQLTNRYLAVALRQRLGQRMAEGATLGLALESLSAANLPYLQTPSVSRLKGPLLVAVGLTGIQTVLCVTLPYLTGLAVARATTGHRRRSIKCRRCR